MSYDVPQCIKIYHILHYDKLYSVVGDAHLWSDAKASHKQCGGTSIGMSEIKARRLGNKLQSHPGLKVGECVPFYFCPRSVMLYVIYANNHPTLQYQEGQEPILHLQADFHKVVKWAKCNNKRWAFTFSNAGSCHFEDSNDINKLCEINWDAVQDDSWRDYKEPKQAEFLLEDQFPWSLVNHIGCHSDCMKQKVQDILQSIPRCHSPVVSVEKSWYY